METGTEKAIKETVESGTEAVAREAAEEGTEKIMKEIADESVEATNVVVHRYIECRNQGLEGTRHPITEVEFTRKTLDNSAGELVEGIFLRFDSAFDTNLPQELYQESNFKQFKEANSNLIDAIDSTPELKNQFTSEQIEQIRDGITTGAASDICMASRRRDRRITACRRSGTFENRTYWRARYLGWRILNGKGDFCEYNYLEVY